MFSKRRVKTRDNQERPQSWNTVLPRHRIRVIFNENDKTKQHSEKQEKQANSMGNLCPPPYFYLRFKNGKVNQRTIGPVSIT